MQTDSLFYRLFQNWPQLALNLLQLPYPADQYQFVSEEIKQTGFRIDGLFKPLESDLHLPLIFAEVQFQPDKDFYGRFFSEICLYLYRQKPERLWKALVIYPNRATERSPALEFAFFLNLPELTRIYLDDFQDNTQPVYAMLRLISCSDDETSVIVQLLIKQAEHIDKDVIEFIETVLVYKLPHLSREEIRSMLGLNDVQLKQTRFYQEIAEEERREGKQEGKQEGWLAGEKHLLTRLLNKRFGTLPQAVLLKLQQAELSQLELWSDRLLDAESLEQVFIDDPASSASGL